VTHWSVGRIGPKAVRTWHEGTGEGFGRRLREKVSIDGMRFGLFYARERDNL